MSRMRIALVVGIDYLGFVMYLELALLVELGSDRNISITPSTILYLWIYIEIDTIVQIEAKSHARKINSIKISLRPPKYINCLFFESTGMYR